MCQQHFVGVFFRFPASDDFARKAVNHDNRGFAPKAHIQAILRLIPDDAIGIRVGAQRPLADERSVSGIEFRNRVTDDVRRPKRLTIRRKHKSCRGSTLPVWKGLREDDLGLVGEQALTMIEPVDHVVPTAADVQRPTVARPGQSSECFGHCDSSDDLSVPGIHGDDFVLAISRMQDRENIFGWMLFDQHGKIAQFGLSTGSFDGPAVGKQHRSVVSQSGPDSLVRFGLLGITRRWRHDGCTHQQETGLNP